MHNPASNNKHSHCMLATAGMNTRYTVGLRPTTDVARGKMINKGSQLAGQKMAMLLLCICI